MEGELNKVMLWLLNHSRPLPELYNKQKYWDEWKRLIHLMKIQGKGR